MGTPCCIQHETANVSRRSNSIFMRNVNKNPLPACMRIRGRLPAFTLISFEEDKTGFTNYRLCVSVVVPPLRSRSARIRSVRSCPSWA